jgi:hypothetical protein
VAAVGELAGNLSADAAVSARDERDPVYSQSEQSEQSEQSQSPQQSQSQAMKSPFVVDTLVIYIDECQ